MKDTMTPDELMDALGMAECTLAEMHESTSKAHDESFKYMLDASRSIRAALSTLHEHGAEHGFHQPDAAQSNRADNALKFGDD